MNRPSVGGQVLVLLVPLFEAVVMKRPTYIRIMAASNIVGIDKSEAG
jgi:hypothetical protein